MSVVITAVPSAPSGIESPPAPSSLSERALMDVVASQTAASAMPHLASPAALASELFGSLRGYLERAKIHDKQLQSSRADADGVRVAALAVAGEPRADLHGGPAREKLEPADTQDGGVPSAAALGLSELERAQDLALEAMKFMFETTAVVSGIKQTTSSVQNLLRGQ